MLFFCLALPAEMENSGSNTRFVLYDNAPFALQGALHNSNSSFSKTDGFGRSFSNLEHARVYSSLPSRTALAKVCAVGSRPLHTSRSLSAPVSNRPLSPHLPLKKPQLSATYSISHRIFGAALGAAIIFVPLATKFSLMFDV